MIQGTIFGALAEIISIYILSLLEYGNSYGIILTFLISNDHHSIQPYKTDFREVTIL